MTEAQFYEKIGRLAAQLDSENADFDTALNLIAGMLTGEIDPARVLVNLTERSVMWLAEGERPGLPATINGVPRCVVSHEITRAEQGALLASLQTELAAAKAEIETLKPRSE